MPIRHYTRPLPSVFIPIGPSIAYVPLDKGMYALIDSYNAERVSVYRWRAHWARGTKSYYAATCVPGKGSPRRYHLSMHRFLLGLEKGDPRLGDHRSGETLNNLMANLRIASRSQNNSNSRVRRGTQSGLKGAKRISKSTRWAAHISIDGVTKHLGAFDTPEQAHECYKQAALKRSGAFCRFV